MISRSLAFDEGMSPEPSPWAEYKVVGPRTTPAMAQAIRAPGTNLVIKVQPVRWLRADGTPEKGWPWDEKISTIPPLYCADGSIATLNAPAQGMGGSAVIDYAAANTANVMAVYVSQLCRSLGAIGVLLDYGAGVENMSPSLSKPIDWAHWNPAYARYRRAIMDRGLRLWIANNRQVTTGASLCIEGIRMSGKLTGYPPNPTQAYNLGLSNPNAMMLVEYPDVELRKQVVSAAILTNGLVDYRPNFFTGDRVTRESAPELL